MVGHGRRGSNYHRHHHSFCSSHTRVSSGRKLPSQVSQIQRAFNTQDQSAQKMEQDGDLRYQYRMFFKAKALTCRYRFAPIGKPPANQ
jgi:hypothetical protein